MRPQTNLVGKKFNKLLVIELAGHNRWGKSVWLCLCDCGGTKIIQHSHLKSGSTKACGCLEKTHRLKHGDNRQGKRSAEYRSWSHAKGRCFNPSDPKYPRYGARGIIMCDRWKYSFDNFLFDMGRKPSEIHSIDRINNDGNYEPSNCKWSTPKEQAINQTRFKKVKGV